MIPLILCGNRYYICSVDGGYALSSSKPLPIRWCFERKTAFFSVLQWNHLKSSMFAAPVYLFYPGSKNPAPVFKDSLF